VLAACDAACWLLVGGGGGCWNPGACWQPAANRYGRYYQGTFIWIEFFS
jgi:hypothetical protein